MKFFAYRHVNRGIKVRRYDLPFGKEVLGDAEESDFVDEVLQPYEAANRAEAEMIAKKKLGKEK
jgi:hypothetical protein